MMPHFLVGYASIFALSQCVISIHGKDAAAQTSEIEEIEEFDQVPLDMLVDLPTSPVDDRVALDKNEQFPSDEFTGINFDSGGTSQNTKENAIKPMKKMDVMKTRVKAEDYCETVYDPETLEMLLYFGEKYAGPDGNWWRTALLRENVPRPYCSTFPLIPLSFMTAQISTHEFFSARGIHIPRGRGQMSGFRRLEFQSIYHPLNPIDKLFLECHCQISDVAGVALETVNNICVDGKVVNLSRGVGGNQSFFVFMYNSSSGNFNVIAHICFA